MKIQKLLIISLGFLIAPALALAAGIQVSPAKLDITISGTKTAITTLTVVNPTANVQVFEVYADDFTEAIKPQPESFTLESGASKTVTITVEPQALKGTGNQKFSTNLSVVAKPLADNQFSVGTGVKIPLTLSYSNGPQTNNTQQIVLWSALLGVLIILLVIYNYKTARRVK